MDYLTPLPTELRRIIFTMVLQSFVFLSYHVQTNALRLRGSRKRAAARCGLLLVNGLFYREALDIIKREGQIKLRHHAILDPSLLNSIEPYKKRITWLTQTDEDFDDTFLDQALIQFPNLERVKVKNFAEFGEIAMTLEDLNDLQIQDEEVLCNGMRSNDCRGYFGKGRSLNASGMPVKFIAHIDRGFHTGQALDESRVDTSPVDAIATPWLQLETVYKIKVDPYTELVLDRYLNMNDPTAVRTAEYRQRPQPQSVHKPDWVSIEDLLFLTKGISCPVFLHMPTGKMMPICCLTRYFDEYYWDGKDEASGDPSNDTIVNFISGVNEAVREELRDYVVYADAVEAARRHEIWADGELIEYSEGSDSD